MLENEVTSFSTGQIENTVFTSKSLHPSLLMTMFELFFFLIIIIMVLFVYITFQLPTQSLSMEDSTRTIIYSLVCNKINLFSAKQNLS